MSEIDSGNKHLLIVEDDAGFAKTLKRSFERRGYTVVHASTVEEVPDALEERSFGYAVVDLKLGGEDGLTLAVYINNALRGPSVTADKSGAALNFNRDLGQLAVGDTVYVVLGAGANQNYDTFKNLNFVLQRLMPPVIHFATAMSVPEPTSAALLGAATAVGVSRRRRTRPARSF